MLNSESYTLYADGIIRDSKNQVVEINEIKSRLHHINIAAEVESISDSTFIEFQSLKSVRFAKGSQLKSMGMACFAYCKALKTIEIPASVESINDTTFFVFKSL